MERIRTKANANRDLFLEDERATVMDVADFFLNEQLRINITYNKKNNKPNKQISIKSGKKKKKKKTKIQMVLLIQC